LVTIFEQVVMKIGKFSWNLIGG